jgi:cell wall-associated NlpC family hydrolase
MLRSVWYYMVFVLLLACCKREKPTYVFYGTENSVTTANRARNYILLAGSDSAGFVTRISTGKTRPDELISYAKSLIGTPYKYASTDPREGFDCSGFIAHVFNHFDIAVPRSSIDFTFVRHEVSLKDARPGDLILFTGTDSTIRKVGHMGIILSNPGEAIRFIHSTSGKQNGVTETVFEGYYIPRYVKTIRVF